MTDHLFSGLKVIDCATVIAAPAAAMILADFGADVIKIEQPGEGDMLRMLVDIPTTPYADSNWFWELDGRNKRSITLDLKTGLGLEILHRLVADCDVFITNYPHSVRESLGLTYEKLKPLNDKMIYASLTAYGETGEERDKTKMFSTSTRSSMRVISSKASLSGFSRPSSTTSPGPTHSTTPSRASAKRTRPR